MKKTGALLIGHARLENLEDQIEKLTNFPNLEIFVWIDKGKNPELIKLQHEFTNSLSHKNIPQANINLTDANLGLAESIPAAISWMFESVEEGIILEDDIEFGDAFINFTLSALRQFQDNFEIWMVAGSNPLQKDKQAKYQIELTTYPVIWGWGTWKSRWREIEKLAINSSTAPNNHTNSFRVRRYWKNGWYKTRLGILNSWANVVAGYQHDLGKMTVMPPVNLIKNHGNDGKGTHKNSDSYVGQEIQPSAIEDISWQIPDSIQVATNDLRFEQEIFFVQSASVFNSYLCSALFKARDLQSAFRLGKK